MSKKKAKKAAKAPAEFGQTPVQPPKGDAPNRAPAEISGPAANRAPAEAVAKED